MRSDGPDLRAVEDRQQKTLGLLRRVLGTTDVDEHGVEHHGLRWWYPQVKRWPAVRSVGSGGSGGSGAGAPLNVEAVDFIGGHYWVGERSQERCSHAELMDEDNYRAGFEVTVLGLERAARRALGQNPPPRLPSTGDPLQPLPAVQAALAYLEEFAPEIAQHEFLLELVREEAIRLVVRARGMMHGSRFSAGRGPCPHCHQVESVISDEDRAFCDNQMCRTRTGERHCWRFLEGQWVEVPEPDIRGRGQVTDEQLSRWRETG